MHRKIWPLIALTIMLSVLFTQSASRVLGAQASSFSNLTLEIATTKEHFVLWEPIPIILTLSNKTQDPIIGHTALGFSFHHIELFTVHNGERRKIEDLSPLQKLVRVNPKKIGPGERHKANQLLTLDLDKVFPEPGYYQIEAVLHNIGGKEKIKSNLLDIYMREPVGLDLLAHEYIKRNANPSYFFTGLELSNSEQAEKALHGFISNFPETSYWVYAADLLCGFYRAGKEYEKAAKLCGKVAAKAIFVFADRALYDLVQVHGKMGDLGKARSYVQILRSLYPQSDYVQRAEVFISQESRKR